MAQATTVSQPAPLDLSAYDYQAQLNELLPADRRQTYLNIARGVLRDNPTPPEGYSDLESLADNPELQSQITNREGLDELVQSLNNPDTGFNSHVYVNNQSGEVVLAFEGSKDGQDIQNNLSLMAGRTPAQVQDALRAFQLTQRFAQQNGLGEPVVVGHSLGGYLAQCMPAQLAVNFSGPGAGRTVQELREQGVYSAMGLPEQAESVVNIGSQADPVYSLVDADANFDFESDNDAVTSPHVEGRRGGTFYLQGEPTNNPIFNGRNHFKFWDELATGTNFTDNQDRPDRYNRAMDQTFPLANRPPDSRSIYDPFSQNRNQPGLQVNFSF